MIIRSLLAKSWAILIGSVVTILGLIKAIDWITRSVRDAPVLLVTKVSSGGVSLEAGHYTYNFYAVFAAISITTFLFIFVILLLMDKIKVGNRRKKDLVEDINFSAHNNKKIINQLSNDTSHSILDFKSIDYDCRVEANGDSDIVHRLSIKAVDEPVQFWEYSIEADEGAYASNSVSDINLTVESPEPETDIALLMMDSNPISKKFAIFFLPKIKPGESREFIISYKWPGFMNKLIEDGKTNYHWKFSSRNLEAETDTRIRVQFDKSLGYISCKNQGTAINNQHLFSKQLDDGRLCWEYCNPAAKFGHRKIEFLFSRTD